MSYGPAFIEPKLPETFYCGVETRAASWYVDPEPAEYCENEVGSDGEVCGFHDEDSMREAAAEDYAEQQREDRRLGL